MSTSLTLVKEGNSLSSTTAFLVATTPAATSDGVGTTFVCAGDFILISSKTVYTLRKHAAGACEMIPFFIMLLINAAP